MQSATHLRCDFSPESTDVAGYFHTGGTTGAPKIVPLTHHNQTYMAWALGCSGAYLDGAVILGGLPLFHVNALHVTGLGPFMHGRPVVSLGPAGYRDSRLMAEFWRIIEHYRVTTFSAVPTVYASLPPIPAEANISSLRGGAVGSAPLPARVRSTFEETTKVPMIEGWGLTEATCTSTATPVVAPRPGSVGQRLPYQRVKAVELDTDGSPIADCAEGQPGVLAIKGPNVFPGYLRAGRTGPVLDPAGKIYNGWLVTGDLGHVDRDGYVYLTGRAGDLIIRGGHNIDPIPIEDSLLAHPAISAAAVVGHPDPHSGEVPAAYVTLHPDAHPDHSELTVWAVEHAPEPAAAPKYLHIVGTLPTTGIGKVHKNALREDAVRRAVVNELTTLGVTGTVLVTTRDGRPEADIDLTADQTKSETLRDSLDRYTFSYRINASHERHDRQGAS